MQSKFSYASTTLLESPEGRRMTVDQSPQKYGTGPGLNVQPLDLQSDTYLQPDTLPPGSNMMFGNILLSLSGTI